MYCYLKKLRQQIHSKEDFFCPPSFNLFWVNLKLPIVENDVHFQTI